MRDQQYKFRLHRWNAKLKRPTKELLVVFCAHMLSSLPIAKTERQ